MPDDHAELVRVRERLHEVAGVAFAAQGGIEQLNGSIAAWQTAHDKLDAERWERLHERLDEFKQMIEATPVELGKDIGRLEQAAAADRVNVEKLTGAYQRMRGAGGLVGLGLSALELWHLLRGSK